MQFGFVFAAFLVSIFLCERHVLSIKIDDQQGIGNMPGRLAIWKSPQQQETASVEEEFAVRHHSKSLTTDQVKDHVHEHTLSPHGLIVVLKHQDASKSLLTDSAVMRAVKAAAAVPHFGLSHFFTTVYRASEQDAEVNTPLANALSSIPALNNVKQITVDKLVKLLQQKQTTAAATGAYEVAVSDAELTQGKLSSLLSTASSAMFLTYQEPQRDAVASRLPKSQYHRILSSSSDSSVDTTDPTSIYYKPEGAEYSIYYADTYLYITPDIFTGLITGIFMVFTVMIGLSCMGNIQGMSSFYDKCPPVGREA